MTTASAQPATKTAFRSGDEILIEAYRAFASATDRHELTVVREDGVYRHLRVGARGTSMWAWHVVTWPGYLAITGDVADGYVFARVTDMLDFFRLSPARRTTTNTESEAPPSIDYSYWAEKVQGRQRCDLREFSRDAFLEAVHDDLFASNGVTDFSVEADMRKENEPKIADAIKTLREQVWSDAQEVSDLYGQDRGFYEWLSEYEVEVPETLQDALALRSPWAPWADDYYEMDITEWDHQFLIACWALDLTVRLWDARVAEHGASDGFSVLEGGEPANGHRPAHPIYDLDVLAGSDRAGVEALFHQMLRNPNRYAVRPYLERVAKRLAELTPNRSQRQKIAQVMERHGQRE